LGIASRKAGTEIECPKCGFSQTVPSEEATAAAKAMSEFMKPAHAVEDDLTGAITLEAADDGPEGPTVEGEPPSAEPEQPPDAPSPAPVEPIPPGMILYRRSTLYVHGLLFVLLAGGAFAGGYFVGRGDATVRLEETRQEKEANERVLLEGKLYYNTGAGEMAGDSGAVIIALPAEKHPQTTLSIQGLRPRDPLPAEDDKCVQAIEDLGGGCARAGDSGAFALVLPEEGAYWLLLVSHQTTRNEETFVDELELKEIRRYFHLAEDLIGRYKHRWTLEDVRLGFPPIDHNFGRDGEQ
jgi:hypothetical protein